MNQEVRDILAARRKFIVLEFAKKTGNYGETRGEFVWDDAEVELL